MNIEALWGVSDEKNRICSEIAALRAKIASFLDLDRGPGGGRREAPP
jgi:hypothetical protein